MFEDSKSNYSDAESDIFNETEDKLMAHITDQFTLLTYLLVHNGNVKDLADLPEEIKAELESPTKVTKK